MGWGKGGRGGLANERHGALDTWFTSWGTCFSKGATAWDCDHQGKSPMGILYKSEASNYGLRYGWPLGRFDEAYPYDAHHSATNIDQVCAGAG